MSDHTFRRYCPYLRADLILVARDHCVFRCTVRHSSNANEHEARRHDQHRRNSHGGPSPLVDQNGEDQASGDGTSDDGRANR